MLSLAAQLEKLPIQMPDHVVATVFDFWVAAFVAKGVACECSAHRPQQQTNTATWAKNDCPDKKLMWNPTAWKQAMHPEGNHCMESIKNKSIYAKTA